MRKLAAMVRVDFVFSAMTLVFGSIPSGCDSGGLDAPAQAPIVQAAVGGPLREVDMLFMVDNSGSMLEEQAKLRRNIPALISSLRALPGGLPNLHLGIVSSDVGAGNLTLSGNPACSRPGGDSGRFQVKAGCGLDGTQGNFLISLNNDTQHNFTGALEDVFSCLADLGARGCGFEHPLQSIRVALAEKYTPENSGFLRGGALLVIVMLTDEDDCSGTPNSDLFVDTSFEGQSGSLRCNIAGHLCNGAPPPGMPFTTALANCTAAPSGRLIPVKEFTQFLFDLKPGAPERIIVSAITGLPKPGQPASYAFSTSTRDGGGVALLEVEPICSAGTAGAAAPSLRTTEFVKAFGANGTLESICEDDFKPAFGRLGALIAARLSNPSPDGGVAADANGVGGTGGMATRTDAGALPTSGDGAVSSEGLPAGGTGGARTADGGSGGGMPALTDTPESKAGDEGGCGCRLGSRQAQPSYWAGLLVAGAVIHSLRRRRRG